MTCPVIEQSPLLYAIDGQLGYHMMLKTIVLATAIVLAAAKEQLWYVLPRMVGG